MGLSQEGSVLGVEKERGGGIGIAGRANRLLVPAMGAVVGLALWQGIIVIFNTPDYVLPTPRAVFTVLTDSPKIWFHAQRTLLESVVGFLIGGGIAFLLGIGLAYFSLFQRLVLPYVIAANTIPVVAIAPIVLLWFGPGIGSKIFVTAFLTFFPVTVNTMRGMRAADPLARDLMKVVGASGWQEFRMLRLQSSLPFVFAGLKIGATLSVIGAIVGEFVGATRGLGYLMVQSSYLLDTPTLFASMIASSLMGIAFFGAVSLLERVAVPWEDASS